MKKIASAIILPLLLSSWGCLASSKSEENILVKLNGETITLEEFEAAYYSPDRNYGGRTPVGQENSARAKAAFLKQMIEEKLILMEAKKLGITVGNEEIDATVAEVQKNYGDNKSFEKVFINDNIDMGKWREKIRNKLLIEKVISRSVSAKVEVTPEDIRDFYDNSIEDFRYDEKVKARQILLREELAAVKARERIRAGESFAAVAAEISLSPDAKGGGDLGFFGRGVMPPEFDAVVFTLKPGTLSEVVRSPFGYHIFLVEERKAAGELTFDEAKDKIAATIRRAREEELYSEWIEGLRKKTPIEIKQDVLQKSVAAK